MENINIGDPVTLSEVLNRAGFDGDALLRDANANRDGCKERLSQNFSEAISLGLFGAPSFQVNQGHVIFG